MAQNLNVKLTLGWHVLRNKGFDTLDDTPEQRDKRESAFFATSVWDCLDPAQLGVEALRERLREVLWNQIRKGLPGVKTDVQTGIKDCRTKLAQLGDARDTMRAKQKYLLHISSRLTKLIRAAIDGVYADRFFESYPGQTDAFERRTRANVQRILSKYASEMDKDGHAVEVVEDDLEPTRLKHNTFVYRRKYLVLVKKLMEECRGRELPGTYVSPCRVCFHVFALTGCRILSSSVTCSVVNANPGKQFPKNWSSTFMRQLPSPSAGSWPQSVTPTPQVACSRA